MTRPPEIEVGTEMVDLVDDPSPMHVMDISVITPHAVRVRVRDADGRLLADFATTPLRALNIAGLFKLAAERADPALVDKVVDLGARR